MIRTKLLPKLAEVFYPILHFSLGPKSVGSRYAMIDESYGYLWLLVQDPDTGALKLFLVNDADGKPYNWYISSDIPPTVSTSNPVSLYLPNSESITWATFAFTEEGEPLFAVQKELSGHNKIEVYDRNGNLWLEVTNAKSPFIVPEALINRKVFGSNVYLFYVTSSDTEIRYQGVTDDSDFGVLTSVPVNFRNNVFLVDYTYRNDGIELVYSNALRSYMYVHVEAEAYHLDEEASVASSLFFERIQKAIRSISRVGVFPQLSKSFVKNIYLEEPKDDTSAISYLTKWVVDKIYKKEIQDDGEMYTSFIVNPVQKVFVGDSAYPDEVNTSAEVLAKFSTFILNMEQEDNANALPGYNVHYYKRAYPTEDNANALPGYNVHYYKRAYPTEDNARVLPTSNAELRTVIIRLEMGDNVDASPSYNAHYYRKAHSLSSLSDDLSASISNLGMAHKKQFISQNSDECIMNSSLYMRFRRRVP